VTDEQGKVVNLGTRGLKYRVRVVINHPSDNLAIITQLTGLVPLICWTKGEERFAPNGTRLAGKHQFSRWGYSRTLRDSRAFSLGVRATIDALAAAADVLQRICATDGRAQLIIDFEGHKNIGDAITASDLSRLAQLGVSLGIEVYPHGLK
jgi:hypothetical protein